MKLNKLLPIFGTIAATSAIVVPLTTSCSNKGVTVSWKQDGPDFGYSTDPLSDDTPAASDDNATKMYFTADNAKLLYSEDIVNMIANHDLGQPWYFPYTIDNVQMLFMVMPTSVSITTTKIDYHDAKHSAVISTKLSISGNTTIYIYDLIDAGTYYANLTIDFTDIPMCVNYNKERTDKEKWYKFWNVSNTYFESTDRKLEPTSNIETSIYVPALAKQWIINEDYRDLLGMEPRLFETILSPICPSYIHYFKYVQSTRA